MLSTSFSTAAVLLASRLTAGALMHNELAVTPQMGWDNWNAFGCDVSEDLLLTTASAMRDYGLKDLGYNYVILDDCWSAGRNEYRIQVPNPLKFPSTCLPSANLA